MWGWGGQNGGSLANVNLPGIDPGRTRREFSIAGSKLLKVVPVIMDEYRPISVVFLQDHIDLGVAMRIPLQAVWPELLQAGDMPVAVPMVNRLKESVAVQLGTHG